MQLFFWCSSLPPLDIQCYHSHGSIKNAVAVRSMWVTIFKLFSCCSTFLDFLFSAAHTQTTQLFTYCCQSHWHTQKWWLHLSVSLRGKYLWEVGTAQMPTTWSSSLFSILLLNADSLWWQWITPPQYTAQLVTATYTVLGWKFYCSRSRQSCYTQLLSFAACKWIPHLSSLFPCNTWHHTADATSNFLSCATPGYLFFKPLCCPRLLINFDINWQILARHQRGEMVNYEKLDKEK